MYVYILLRLSIQEYPSNHYNEQGSPFIRVKTPVQFSVIVLPKDQKVKATQ